MGDLASWAGVILQTLVIAGTLAVFLFRISTDVKIIAQRQSQTETRVGAIDVKMEKLSSLVVEIAKQDQRLNFLDARVQELSSRLYAHLQKDGIE